MRVNQHITMLMGKFGKSMYRVVHRKGIVDMTYIFIKIVPHNAQRYETAGDWYYENEYLVISVSDTGNRRSNMLVAIHELVEAVLCERDKIRQEEVDSFDRSYSGDGEPGDSKESPYRDQHCFAMAVERMLCAAMSMSWKEHEERVDAL